LGRRRRPTIRIRTSKSRSHVRRGGTDSQNGRENSLAASARQLHSPLTHSLTRTHASLAASDGVSSLAFSPTANFLVATSWSGQCLCWDVQPQSGQVLPKAGVNLTKPVLCSAWNGDGSSVFVGGCDNGVQMWNLATNQQQQIGGFFTTPFVVLPSRPPAFGPIGRRMNPILLTLTLARTPPSSSLRQGSTRRR